MTSITTPTAIHLSTPDSSPTFMTTIMLRTGLVFRDVEAHCSVNHEYHLALSTWHLNTLLQERDQLARNVLALQTQESLMRQQQGRRLNL